MVAKHTPGPWHWWTYTDVDGDPRLDGRAYTVHVFSFKAPTAAWGGYEIGNDDEAKANARLIAAAPELLAALNGLVGLVQLVRGRPDCPVEIKQALTDNYRLDDAFAAIAKAEGT